jgi:UDP:flavonoid glycosyltransferase YjiC (YdhE family)
MNFLVYVSGTRGDIQPFLGIGNMLKKKNINLIFLSNSDNRNFIEKAGFKMFSFCLDKISEKKNKTKKENNLLNNINFIDDSTRILNKISGNNTFAIYKIESNFRAIYYGIVSFFRKIYYNSYFIIKYLNEKYKIKMVFNWNHGINLIPLICILLNIRFMNFYFYPLVIESKKYPHPFLCCKDSLPYPWNYISIDKSWDLWYNIWYNSIKTSSYNLFKDLNINYKLNSDEIKTYFKNEPIVNAYSTHFHVKHNFSKKSNIIDSGFLFLKQKKGKIDKITKKFISNSKKNEQKIIFVGFGSMKFKKSKTLEIFFKLNNFLKYNKMYTIILANNICKDIIKFIEKGEEYIIHERMYLLSHGLPYNILFKYVDLVVCHGGIGTITTAFLLEKPVLIIPVCCDQFYNGLIVRDKKLGHYLLSQNIYLLDRLILKIIKSKVIKNNVNKISKLIKEEKSYKKLWNFIEKMLNSNYYDNLEEKFIIKND